MRWIEGAAADSCNSAMLAAWTRYRTKRPRTACSRAAGAAFTGEAERRSTRRSGAHREAPRQIQRYRDIQPVLQVKVTTPFRADRVYGLLEHAIRSPRARPPVNAPSGRARHLCRGARPGPIHPADLSLGELPASTGLGGRAPDHRRAIATSHRGLFGNIIVDVDHCWAN